MADAYPLAWPSGWKRTPANDRRSAPYKMAPSKSMEHLQSEIAKLGAVGAIVISTNVPTRRDGSPIANGANPDDPGAAVYWSTKAWKDRVIACDKWDKLYDNIHAIGLAVAAMRAIERAGATQISDRAFSAFGALPASSSAPVVRPWWEVFALPESAIGALSFVMVEAQFRQLAKKAHPDHGGSTAAMVELTSALDQARRHYGGK